MLQQNIESSKIAIKYAINDLFNALQNMGFARHLNMIFVLNAANVIAIHVLNGDDVRINSYLHPTFCRNIRMLFYIIKAIRHIFGKRREAMFHFYTV